MTNESFVKNFFYVVARFNVNTVVTITVIINLTRGLYVTPVNAETDIHLAINHAV